MKVVGFVINTNVFHSCRDSVEISIKEFSRVVHVVLGVFHRLIKLFSTECEMS